VKIINAVADLFVFHPAVAGHMTCQAIAVLESGLVSQQMNLTELDESKP